MATAEVLKEAVYDSRVIQPTPVRYAVERGGLAVTATPYAALSQSTNQHSFQVNVPSQSVWVDRKIDWQSTVSLFFRVAIDQGVAPQPAAGVFQPVTALGRDVALAPTPLHSLVNTATANVNDTSVTINTDTVLYEILRLCDYKRNRLSATAPRMLDKFAYYAYSGASVNSSLTDYLSQTEAAEAPNGAFWNIVFLNPVNSEVLTGDGNYTFGGTQVFYRNGVPRRTQVGTAEPANYPLAIRFTSTEAVVLSPFIFANAAEWDTGIFGVNNMTFVFTLKSNIQRVLRNSTQFGRAIVADSIAYQGEGFSSTRLLVQYITPPLDLPLPTISTVPFLEYPRYPQVIGQSLPGGSLTENIQSPNIVLPVIPDALVIYCKKNTYTPQEGEWYLPIKRISLNFDKEMAYSRHFAVAVAA